VSLIARVPHIGPSESQSIAEAQARTVAPFPGRSPRYRSVSQALAWFRAEWQASLPQRIHEGWSSVEPDDALGAPAFTQRFLRYLLAGDDGQQRDPLRSALARMRRSGSVFERCGALYLFVLACSDFDPETAGKRMGGRCICQQPEHHERQCPVRTSPILAEYVVWYCEKALERLAEVMEQPQRRQGRAVERPHWMDRIGFDPRGT